jgi:hypothetical protein
MAFPGQDFMHLNPQKKDIVGFSPDVMNLTASDSLIQQRSNEERKATAIGTLETWKKGMVDHFKRKGVSDFFKESDQGRKYASELNKVLGIDVNNLTEAHADKIYTRFCADTTSGTSIYVSDIVNSYKDLKELEESLGAFEWFGNILGANTREVLAQKIYLMKRGETDQGKKELADEVNKDNKINIPDTDEIRSLTFLFGDSKSISPTPKIEVGTTDKKPEGPKPQAEKKHKLTLREEDKKIDPDLVPEHNLVEIFGKYDYPVNPKTVGSWFVENPPINMDSVKSDEITPLVFSPQRVWLRPSYTTNKQINPHVWDLMPGDNDPKGDIRFTNMAYALTRDDSSILALAAAASGDPDKQALLYKDITQLFIQGFRTDPELFYKWYDVQSKQGAFSYLEKNDQEWVNLYNGDKNYEVIPTEDTGAVSSETRMNEIWLKRIGELEEAVNKGKFTLAQHRWIETLSKMIDIRKTVDLIKSKQAPKTS